MGWKDVLCYSDDKYCVHVVNGIEQKFWPVSVGQIFRLRALASDLAKNIAHLFADLSKDAKVITQGGQNKDYAVQNDPVSLDMAKYRDTQRSEAWGNIIEQVTAQETQAILAEIIMDSMREVFKDSKPTASEFAKQTPLPVMIEMVMGVAKANVDVFGPLGKRVTSVLSQLAGPGNTKQEEVPEVTPQASL